jgi:hypothetical protein
VAFALRVGALDGRYPELTQAATARLRASLVPKAQLWVDGRQVPLG